MTLTGHTLAGRYRLDTVVGRGGMATVYRAVDESLGRVVAIKVFRPELATPEDIRRQQDEISLIAGLSHPCLVTLFDAVADDAGEEAARAFLVMQYIDGRDLGHRLQQADPLAPGTVAAIGADVASALAYLADRRVVHRDLKPANILLPSPGGHGPRALIADFGIARIVDATRLTATGSIIGTANYLSPEQAVGQPVDSPSDVYSLGLVLMEALSGEKNFSGTPAESLAARLGSDPAVPTGFGDEWFDLLTAMTARDPADRIGAEEAATVLAGLADTTAEEAESTTLMPVEELPTALMTAPSLAPTEILAPHVQTERLVRATSVRPAGRESPPKRERRWLPVAVIAGAAIVAAGGVAWMFGQAPQATDGTPVEYPVVEGELGIHLDQLQQSVAP